MDFDELIAILERIKDDLLVPVDGNILDAVRINHEGVNHGVMQMYYGILMEVLEARIREMKGG